MRNIPLIKVTAVSKYVPQQSDSNSSRFVFAYTITIKNMSLEPVQLLSRQWLIQDANQKVEEVLGDGVIGQQPLIQPGNEFTYSSGAVLETDMGTMEGSYIFVSKLNGETSEEFSVPIPKFLLSVPRTLH